MDGDVFVYSPHLSGKNEGPGARKQELKLRAQEGECCLLSLPCGLCSPLSDAHQVHLPRWAALPHWSAPLYISP